MFRAMLYSFGLNFLFRKLGGRRGSGGHGSSRMRPFSRRW